MGMQQPTSEGYYWTQKDKTHEIEVVQVKGGNDGFFTVFRCGFEKYYTVDDFIKWGGKIKGGDSIR